MFLVTAHAQTSQLLSASDYSVVDRGSFYRVWQRTELITNYLTGEIRQDIHGYTELGNGMHYWENGQWNESKDLIELTPTGAAAVHGQIKVSFAPNLNTAGAITVQTSSGQLFQSHPLGLYYFDAASGKSALVAPLQNTVGQLVPPNQVVYSNAFSGLVADVMYIYAKEGFEQNVVLLQAPPAPETYGLASATSRLEIWTAFDKWPAPQGQQPIVLKQQTDPLLRQTMVDPDLIDHLMFFTDSWFPVGTAFAFDNSTAMAPGQPAPI